MPRLRISEMEHSIILDYRNRHKALVAECEEKGVPPEAVKHYWHKSKHISMFVKDAGKTYWDIRDEVVNDMKRFAPTYPKIYYQKSKDGHLLVIDPADIHIGKLCKSIETNEEYNEEIAITRIREKAPLLPAHSKTVL